MPHRPSLAAIAATAVLLGAAGVSAPAQAERPISARLVHCGMGTCLRLAGRRAGPGVAVRADGHALAVTGERSWRATVPLEEARRWRVVRGYALAVTLADPVAGTEHSQAVAIPPGALGARLELASLIVRAR
jgi:hypothetical protein